MIEVNNLKKAYKPKKGKKVAALKGINLKFEETGLVFILGKSGSGKSTLLNMLGGLDQFDSGEIVIKGKSSVEFTKEDFDSYRNTFIGFIFQEYNILNDFTVGANIALAMELQGKRATNEELNEILKLVGLEGFGNRKPNELSGGQKQRVAIARALIKNPEIIMADEPTGALDSNTGIQVFDTLKSLSKEKLVIVVSHDKEFAELYGDRIIEMRDGEVISDKKKVITEEVSTKGIHFLNDNRIQIMAGYELTEEDTKKINEYLKNHKEKDTYISSVEDENNGYVDTSKTPLNLNTYDGSQLSFIKSKLPMKTTLKMAFGSLKRKPIRLIIAILLSTVAFTLFGIVNTMSFYNETSSAVDSVVNSPVDYISFSKKTETKQNDWKYFEKDYMTENDLKTIQAKFQDNVFTPVRFGSEQVIDFSNNIENVESLEPYQGFQYYQSNFYGVAPISDDMVKNMGYELNGQLPKNEKEIVISKFVAKSLFIGGYIDPKTGELDKTVKNIEDIVGKTLRFSELPGADYTITGILDTKLDDERYKKFTLSKKSNADENTDYNLQSELMSIFMNGYHCLIYVSDNLWKQMPDGYTSVLGKMPANRDKIKDVLLYAKDNEVDGSKYELNLYTLDYVDNISALIETIKPALFRVGIVFAIFAGVLLMNFIAVSITYRKQEIGILRALGARGKDVFSIFFVESLMIALINWLLSNSVSGFIIERLNIMFQSNFHFTFSVFHFGIIQMAIMLLLSVGVAFVSSFVPIYRISKKRPIQIIRKV